MNATTILLVITLLMCLNNSCHKKTIPELPPLDESKVQVHWMVEGEPAPFDGILLNDYTYERVRLKLEALERSL